MRGGPSDGSFLFSVAVVPVARGSVWVNGVNPPGASEAADRSMAADTPSLKGTSLEGKGDDLEGKESSSSVNRRQRGREGNLYIVAAEHQEIIYHRTKTFL